MLRAEACLGCNLLHMNTLEYTAEATLGYIFALHIINQTLYTL